jgi:serine phosphatase RsbU (regulator of sigma subunit)
MGRIQIFMVLLILAGITVFIGIFFSRKPNFSRHIRIAFPVIFANAAGAIFCAAYFAYLDPPSWNPSFDVLFIFGLIVTAGLVALGTFLSNRWSKEFDVIIKNPGMLSDIDPEFQTRVRRKALNAPLVYSAVSLSNWCLASLILGSARLMTPLVEEPWAVTLWAGFRLFFGILISGAATATFVYFYSDYALRDFRPTVFPKGGLSDVPGVFRLSVRSRLMLGFMTVSVGPMILVGVLVYHKATSLATMEPGMLVSDLLLVIFVVLTAMIIMSLVISHICAWSIADPVLEMEQAMARVRKGDLTQKVPIRNNDELGELAESFNLMIDGLEERERMQRSLDLAMEVQQSLLPKKAPKIRGLDMAGISRYCDETGGDYFDYLRVPDGRPGAVRLVVGDVSDHGVQAALLMTTARAFLRQRSESESDLARIVTDVNRHLSRDVEDSGGFMTLFLAEIDVESMSVCWVRAGHQPGWLYDPKADTFDDLAGPGVPLGIADDIDFQALKTGISPGRLVILATDGIWEARNSNGRHFGMDAFKTLIRNNAHRPAEEIVAAVIDAVIEFVQPAGLEDDATLMVVKMASAFTS